MPAVARTGEPPARGYVFAGPEVRRLTAEQFADADRRDHRRVEHVLEPRRPQLPRRRGAATVSAAVDGADVGVYGREWRAASSNLTRALGRPIRDQVTSTRAPHASTLQALELVNGETTDRMRLSRGARRMLGELPPEPLSLYNRTVAGRTATSSALSTSTCRAPRDSGSSSRRTARTCPR